MLHRKLTFKEQEEILSELFGFTVEYISEEHEKLAGIIIYDEDGYEFYAYGANAKYDLTTIFGIIQYVKDIAEERGIRKCENELRSLLGL